MTHQEFREKVLSLTETEEQIKAGSFPELEFMRQLLWDAEKDADGNYFFSNRKMSVSPENYRLRFPISYSAAGNEFRLIIHTRFTELPFHYNEFVSINYVYSGRLTVRFPDKEMVLTNGMLILMNANVVHSLKMEQEEDIILGFQIQREYMNKDLLYGLNGSGPVVDFLLKSILGEKSDFTYTIFDFFSDEKMRFIFEEIFCEYLSPSLCGETLVQNYLRIFFISLIRSSSEQMSDFPDSHITKMLYYIEDHSRNCTLRSLADKFNFSPKYISSLLKEKTGKSFTQLMTDARMKLVCYLLANTDRTIQEIAVTCGYSNQSFFYRKFQECFHVTPKEYRESNRLLIQ